MKVAHEEQRDPGDAFKRAAIGFYLAHHLKLAGFFPQEYDMTDSAESSGSNKDGFFSVKNQTVVTIVTLIVSNDDILVIDFCFVFLNRVSTNIGAILQLIGIMLTFADYYKFETYF